MRGMLKKILAFALAASFLFYVMPDIRMVARATVSAIPADAFNQGEDGNIFEINSTNVEQYNNAGLVIVPEGKTLIVTGVTWTVDEIKMQFDSENNIGSSLNIFDDNSLNPAIPGKIVCNTWSLDSGVTLRVGNATNASASGITLHNALGTAAFSGTPFWETEFVWDNGKWKFLPSLESELILEGLRVETDGGAFFYDYSFDYSYNYYNYYNNQNSESIVWHSGTGRNVGDFVGVNAGNYEQMASARFDLENIPEDWDGSVTLKFTFKPGDTALQEKPMVQIAAADPKVDRIYSFSTDNVTKQTVLTYTLPNFYATSMLIALAYPNQGEAAITSDVTQYLYAYSETTEDSLKTALADELFDRFIRVAMREDFGISDRDVLKSRISLSQEGNISASDKEGNPVNCNKYIATVEWGYDPQGREVVNTIPVYVLPNNKSFLVCTDFNTATGEGTKYYIRNADSDQVPFSGTNQDEGILISDDSYSTVVCGGNAGEMSVMNTDGMFSFRFSKENNYDVIVRVMKPSETYVAIHGEGEDKDVDGMGLNGYQYDDIWSTKTGTTATVYVGNSSVYLEPVSVFPGTTITDVTLVNQSQRDGVTIDKTDLSKVKLTFSSNFYDTIPLEITYSDNSKNVITIQRVGLVISYRYLMDSDNPSAVDRIWYDCKSDTCSFSYNYMAGEQIIVYATYYHPTNDRTGTGSDNVSLYLKYDDGTSEILTKEDSAHNFNGYTGAGSAVATTSFIIGFVNSKYWAPNPGEWVGNITEQTFSKAGHSGGFSATVLNSGYNAADNYGGTLVGSGAGVYWDGRISWY